MKLSRHTIIMYLCTLTACLVSTTVEPGPRPIKGKMPNRMGGKSKRPMFAKIFRRDNMAPESQGDTDVSTAKKTQPSDAKQQLAENTFAPVTPAGKIPMFFNRTKKEPEQERRASTVSRLMKSEEIQRHLASIYDPAQRAYWQDRMRVRLYEHMNIIKPDKGKRYAHMAREAANHSTRIHATAPTNEQVAERVDSLMQNSRLQKTLKKIKNPDQREYMEAVFRLEFFDMLDTDKTNRRALGRDIKI